MYCTIYVPVLYRTENIIMEKIKIGKIVNAVGLKGEVKVYNYSDRSEIYERTPAMYVEDEIRKIENVRLQKNTVILKLFGIDNRNDAEAVKGKELYITEADLPKLPEGQFYVRELIGMSVKEQDGDVLGRVTDVLQNTAQDLLEVEQDSGKKILIPKVNEFVLDIDADKRQIKVKLPNGLLEL